MMMSDDINDGVDYGPMDDDLNEDKAGLAFQPRSGRRTVNTRKKRAPDISRNS